MNVWIFVRYTLVAVGIYVFLRFVLIFQLLGMWRWLAVIISAVTVGLMVWQKMLWGVLFYVVLLLAAGDIIGLIFRSGQWEKIWYGGATGIVIALAISVYGYFHAQNIKTTHYDVHIAKEVSGVKRLRAVLVSDLHLGSAVFGEKELRTLAPRINELKPDIVFLGGDIYDRTSQELIDKSLEIWRTVNAPRGIYFVGGNHEYGRYYGDNMPAMFPKLASAGIRVLEDERVLVDNAFYIIGRIDAGPRRSRSAHFVRPLRPPVTDLISGADMSKPVLLLDHQPIELDAASEAGVDLFMAGHTHAGQLWPFGLAVMLAAPNDVLYGKAQRGNMQVIVSSGAGVWEAPMRVGTNSEIVVIDIMLGRQI